MKKKFPLLHQVHSLFKDVDLSKSVLIACQHLLGTQYRMIQDLINRGLPTTQCFIIGKNYSTNQSVYEKLQQLGVTVDPASISYDPTKLFDEWFPDQLQCFFKKTLSALDISSIEHIILLDDGGLMIEASLKTTLPFEKVYAIEQTSSGWSRIKNLSIPFEVFLVARTHAKLIHETPFITKLCFERIMTHCRNRSLQNPQMFILGNAGNIGKSLEKRFRALNIPVWGHDPKTNSLTGAVLEALASSDVIVGTTGINSLPQHLIETTKPTVSLISVSSSDREFDTLSFRKNGTILHQDHYLEQRCLVNSGFPITFYGNYHEAPARQIEITCGLLLLGIYQGCLQDDDPRRENGFKSIVAARLTHYYLNRLTEKDYSYAY